MKLAIDHVNNGYVVDVEQGANILFKSTSIHIDGKEEELFSETIKLFLYSVLNQNPDNYDISVKIQKKPESELKPYEVKEKFFK